MPITQVTSIVLPDVSAQNIIVGTETETIDDLVEHTSVEFPVDALQEKLIHITATEVSLVPGSVVGTLLCWIELSPYPSANSTFWPAPLPTSTAYWAAIGGGGGAIIPTVPHIEASGLAAAAGTLVHTIILPWTLHSPWCRVILQTPIATDLPLATWVIQAIFTAKTP